MAPSPAARVLHRALRVICFFFCRLQAAKTYMEKHYTTFDDCDLNTLVLTCTYLHARIYTRAVACLSNRAHVCLCLHAHALKAVCTLALNSTNGIASAISSVSILGCACVRARRGGCGKRWVCCHGLNSRNVDAGEALPNKSQGNRAKWGYQRQEHFGLPPGPLNYKL